MSRRAGCHLPKLGYNFRLPYFFTFCCLHCSYCLESICFYPTLANSKSLYNTPVSHTLCQETFPDPLPLKRSTQASCVFPHPLAPLFPQKDKLNIFPSYFIALFFQHAGNRPQSVSSVTQSCPTLGDPMDCSSPGLPVHHQLPESLKLMSIESVMPSNHLILCHPFLLLPSIFPSIGVYSNESVLHIRWLLNY